MIGRINYALSMRRHKRQKSRFQCDGKCTKVGVVRLSVPQAARVDPTESSNNRLVTPGKCVPIVDVLAAQSGTNSSRDRHEVEHRAPPLSGHVFSAMCGVARDHVPMTIGHLTPLTELERDALGEVSNIAMARAANSLRQMVEHEVLLSVPAVEILSQDQATQLVAKPDNPNLVAVRQDFSGAFAGRALLIFPEANSLELVRAVVGRQLPLEDIVDLEDEALAETGNILLNSWVATIANLLKRGLRMSLPVVIRGDSRHMFETGETPERLVLFLHIRFEISKKEIRGYVALLMDIPSMDELRLLIADFVSSVTQKDRLNPGPLESPT
jgi:chemotaxis protein CheC